MKIISAHIKNYRAVEDVRLSFNDPLGKTRPITVISGPNGAGKTSILYAITQALRGAIGYRTADVPPPSGDDVRAVSPTTGEWIAQQREIRVDVLVEFGDDEQDAIREVLKLLKRPPPPELPNGQLKVSWRYPPGFRDDGSRHPWWGASIDPRAPDVRSWLAARGLAIGAWIKRDTGMSIELLRRIGGFHFFPQDRNLRHRVVGNGDSPFSGPVDESSRSESGGEDYDDQSPRERPVADILHYLSDYAKSRVSPPLPDDQNWEKRIRDVFGRVCAPREYVGYLYRGESDQIGAPILREGRSVYPLSHAASGEQVMLEYITRLTYPSPFDRSIILIDEPEIHLHPAWARQLYLALPSIGENNQYIVTSHSSELRRRAVADGGLVDLGSIE